MLAITPLVEKVPATNIMHCTIKVGDSTIMMCDDPRPEAAPGDGNISLAIGLNDPERASQLFGNLADGGSVIMLLEKTYWAEAFGMVQFPGSH
jgi:PhnB protein